MFLRKHGTEQRRKEKGRGGVVGAIVSVFKVVADKSLAQHFENIPTNNRVKSSGGSVVSLR